MAISLGIYPTFSGPNPYEHRHQTPFRPCPRRGKDSPQLAERFLLLDDVVAKELSDLDYPWNLKDQMKPWVFFYGDPEEWDGF